MARGRKPLPDNVRALHGTDRKDRRNPAKPATGTEQLKRFARGLSTAERRHWRILLALLEPARILDNLDGPLLRLMAEKMELYAKAKALVEDEGLTILGSTGSQIKHPALRAMHDAEDRLYRYMAEFGMSPSARQRVVASAARGDESENPFDRARRLRNGGAA